MPRRKKLETNAVLNDPTSDSDNDELNQTVCGPAQAASTPSFELRLEQMMQQIQNLQATVLDTERKLQEGMRASATPASEGENNTTLAAALTELSRSLSTARPESSKRIYDLPEFDGTPECWPMFNESFSMTSEEYQYSERQNMLRLQKALKGKAKESVECLLIHSSNVTQVMKTLKDRFGRPDQLVKSQISKIRVVPHIAENKIEQLVPFATKVQNLSSFLEAAECHHHLSNPTLMEELLMKLPVQRRLEWARHAASIVPVPTIRHFSDWLQELASLVSSICVNLNERSEQADARSGGGRSKFFHADEAKVQTQKKGCVACSGNHDLWNCKRFLELNSVQRWRLVRSKRLCFNCMGGGHRSDSCEQQHKCETKDCKRKVHGLLHNVHVSDQQVNQQPFAPQQQSVFTSTIKQPQENKLLFKILPVKLYANAKEVDCYAFLDEGSAVSLMNKSLADKLGLRGENESLTLQWFGGKTVTEPSQRVNMKISGVTAGSERYDIRNVRTVQDLCLPTQSLNMSELHFKHRHMKKLPALNYSAATPDLLIGLDNASLGVSHQVVANEWKGPIAVLTKLGWLVYGSGNRSDRICEYRAFFAGTSETEETCNLNQLVKEYIADDSLGVRAVANAVEAEETLRAKRCLENTTVRVFERFETGLIWKRDDVAFPESRAMAQKRLFSLEKKFERNEKFHDEYVSIMRDYVNKGFARKLSELEALTREPKTWYLPHFGIFNLNKPGKIRLVFDAAAISNGASLNSELLSGPDLGEPLTTVLMKFRQKPIAVCADIVQMFHQVKIRQEDQAAQRFVWREDKKDPIEDYAMTVMTFGATCSPCSAQYVKNRNASDFRDAYPEAVDAILNNHYVDDFVHCFSNEEEAIKISKRVVWIHKKGGFELKRFTSNSQRVGETLNGCKAENSILSLDKSDAAIFQKVLGMHWDTKRDELKFVLAFGKIDHQLLEGTRKPTKREVLSIIMSLFDPFGVAAEYSLTAKLLLQTIWRMQVDWDDTIPEVAHKIWLKWLCMLEEVKLISIPRCYSSIFTKMSPELHIFVDASEVAYSAVAYWRVEEPGGVCLSFVIGKTKCAPLKLLSVPRLELQSAVLGTRVRQLILRSHDVTPSRVVMWCDSRTVLAWVKSDHRRYKPYVAHRINEILDSTLIADWRWLPTALNPADFGTRMKDNKRKSFWIEGPTFLKKRECEWPRTVESIESTNEETRSKLVLFHINFSWDIFKKFSCFLKLKRVVAWILRFCNNCKTPLNKTLGILKVAELEKSEKLIAVCAQMEVYAEDYRILKAGKPIDRASHLLKLTPKIDEDGLLRVDGRMNAADAVAFDTRCPIILPKDHRLTELICNFYHRKWKHQNEETIIAEIRRRYWIPHIRTAVKRAAKNCQFCKIRNAKPEPPLMGQLPRDRLTPFVRPFTYTGLDFMGPFTIITGRRSEKRWIALFTCMTTRAIHLEIARDLSTETCLMLLRNFMNRRGVPVRIRSDNGTNFVGAERELSRQKIDFDNGKIADALVTQNVEWVFNCPANPHAGGCWERLVRSVKRAIGHALYNKKLQEHSLYSLMCEAENIVNSRPLTHIPLDSPTDQPLTPNHFLLGTANSEQTPHPHEEAWNVTRKQWRIVQQMQHSFWKKWIDEYLPDLCRRTKWYKPMKPLAVDDVVMVCDKTMHQSSWPMGRILRVFPGKDLQVRSAEVRTQKGITMRRPACILAKLDVGES